MTWLYLCLTLACWLLVGFAHAMLHWHFGDGAKFAGGIAALRTNERFSQVGRYSESDYKYQHHLYWLRARRDLLIVATVLGPAGILLALLGLLSRGIENGIVFLLLRRYGGKRPPAKKGSDKQP